MHAFYAGAVELDALPAAEVLVKVDRLAEMHDAACWAAACSDAEIGRQAMAPLWSAVCHLAVALPARLPCTEEGEVEKQRVN